MIYYLPIIIPLYWPVPWVQPVYVPQYHQDACAVYRGPVRERRVEYKL